MTRKTRRRRPRKAEPAAEPLPKPDPQPLTEVERDRIRQRYAHMTGRSVVLGFESIGITVEAKTPEELVEKTDAIITEATKRQPPS